VSLSLPSFVCFGDSGGGIFIAVRDTHGHVKRAQGRLAANVSDGGIDCLSASNHNRLDTSAIQRWVHETIDEVLGHH
jgi:hypothetical protein